MRPLIKAYDMGALICFCAVMGCVLLEVVARNIVHFPTTWAGAISIMIEQYQAKTTALEISISWFYLGLSVGSTGMLIFHLHLMIRTIRNPTDPETMVS